jgi:hypothetical protein
MRTLTGREKVLIGVLFVGGVIALRFLTGEGGLFVNGEEQKDESRSLGKPPIVRVDLLEQPPADFDPKGRNLFAYYVPPRPAPVYTPPPQVIKPPPVETRRELPKPPPPPPPATAKPPEPKFRYIGYVGPKDGKLAAFDNGSGPALLARVGDLVTEQFRLASFEHNAVKLTYTDPRWTGQTAELAVSGKR